MIWILLKIKSSGFYGNAQKKGKNIFAFIRVYVNMGFVKHVRTSGNLQHKKQGIDFNEIWYVMVGERSDEYRLFM